MNNEWKWKVVHPLVCQQKPSFFRTRESARVCCRKWNKGVFKGHKVEHNYSSINDTVRQLVVEKNHQQPTISLWDEYGPELLKHLKKLEDIVENEYPAVDDRYSCARFALDLIRKVERKIANK